MNKLGKESSVTTMKNQSGPNRTKLIYLFKGRDKSKFKDFQIFDHI